MANERLQCPGETGCQWQPCVKGMRKNSGTEKSQAPYCQGAGRKGNEGALAFSVCLELPLSRKASPSPLFFYSGLKSLLCQGRLDKQMGKVTAGMLRNFLQGKDRRVSIC